MSNPTDPKAPQDDWIEVGQRRAAQHNAEAPAPDAGSPQPERVLGTRRSTPAGKISFRVGVTALLIMLALYIFADIREIEVPWQRQFRMGYVLMLVPLFGVLWGVIGLVKREEGDVRKALVGIVLSLAAFGLCAAAIAARTQKMEAESTATDGRTNLSPQDLGKWREEKLHREP